MKVVFFSSTGRMVGGAIMCLKSILLYCKEQGIETFVILRSQGDFEDYLKQQGIRYEIVGYHDWLRPKKDHGGLKNNLKWKAKGVQNFFSERKVYKILKRENPDIYHLNVIYNPCGAESAHKLGIPVVWHLREFAEINDDTPFFRNRNAAYRLISKSEKIICVSDSIREYYSRFMPSDNMIRIYDGIVLPNEKIKQHKRNDVMQITLSGGAIVKGHKDLIDAAKMLVDKGINDFCIRIAGRFVDENYLNTLKKRVFDYGIADKINFIGFQKNMNSIWESTDIAVICSRFESFGLSVCEAMSRAIPVICANSTGTYEVTQKGKFGILYDVGNSGQLADKIIEIMEKYNYYSEKAKATAVEVRNLYSIDKSCEQLVKVFRELIEKV